MMKSLTTFLLFSSLLSLSAWSATGCNFENSEIKKLDLASISTTELKQGVIDNYTIKSTMDYNLMTIYYIPKSLGKDYSNAATVIFMHGGGSSTGGNPQGALSVAKSYMSDLADTAEKLKFILIMPVSPLNWGSNGIYFMRDTALVAKNIFKADSNKIVLMGHSMGGMGIGRNTPMMIDPFAGIMPISSGMDDKSLTKEKLSSYFNTQFRRQQGINDHFPTFLPSVKKENELIGKLSTELGITNLGYKLTLHNGGHNYDTDLLEAELKDVLDNYPRNLFQKRLFGSFLNINLYLDVFSWKVLFHNVAEYFWLEAAKYNPLEEGKTSDHSYFTAEVKDNKLNIEFSNPKLVKTLRLFISDKVFDLNSNIEVTVNGTQVLNEKIEANDEMKKSVIAYKKDSNFSFENCLDIDLP